MNTLDSHALANEAESAEAPTNSDESIEFTQATVGAYLRAISWEDGMAFKDAHSPTQQQRIRLLTSLAGEEGVVEFRELTRHVARGLVEAMLYTGDRNVRDEACEQLVNVFPELAGLLESLKNDITPSPGINGENFPLAERVIRGKGAFLQLCGDYLSTKGIKSFAVCVSWCTGQNVAVDPSVQETIDNLNSEISVRLG